MPLLENRKAEDKLYGSILQSIEKITAICGVEHIEDVALGLNDKEYEIYEKECDNIVSFIRDIVREQEKPFDFSILMNQLPDEGFWDSIKEEVDWAVRKFMDVLPYRRLDRKKRLELVERSFYMIYLQRENRKFLSESIGDPLLSEAVYEILMESEFMVVVNYASKRRFKNFLIHNVKLEEDDLNYIWDLYHQNFSTVLTYVSLKNDFRIMEHINDLEDKFQELLNTLGLVAKMEE